MSIVGDMDEFSDVESNKEFYSGDEEMPFREDLNNLDKMLSFLRNYSPTKKATTRISKSQNTKSPKDIMPNIIEYLGNIKELCDKLADKVNNLAKENVTLKTEMRKCDESSKSITQTYADAIKNISRSSTSITDNPQSNQQPNIQPPEIQTMNKRFDNLEQESFSNVLLLQGPRIEEIIGNIPIPPIRSQESAASLRINVPPPASLKQQISEAVGTVTDVAMDNENVMTLHVFGKDRKSVKITCHTSFLKKKILSDIKLKKPNGIFACEFLTKNRSDMLYRLRVLKRRYPSKIGAAFSRDGSIFYRDISSSRNFVMHDLADINKLEEKLLGSQ